MAVVFVYAPVSRYGFLLYEDAHYVSKNAVVTQGITPRGIAWAFTTWYGANWFPLTWVSHMLDWSLFGNHPGLHHATNVVLHALAAVLLYVWLEQATSRAVPALATAALFAIHPCVSNR